MSVVEIPEKEDEKGENKTNSKIPDRKCEITKSIEITNVAAFFDFLTYSEAVGEFNKNEFSKKNELQLKCNA